MSKSEFAKAVVYMSKLFKGKEDPSRFTAWYKFFKDVSYGAMIKAIESLVDKIDFEPSIKQLREALKEVEYENRLNYLRKMLEAGYFDDENGKRNYSRYYKHEMILYCRDFDTLLRPKLEEYGYKPCIEIKQVDLLE